MSYQPGDILLNGNYRIEREIGQGSFAVVYLATHTVLNVARALKVLRKDSPGVDSDSFDSYSNRFILEAQLGARIRHTNIIQVYEYGLDGDTKILVMEYAEGGNLRERLKKGVLSIEEAIKMMRELCAGLAYLHHKFGAVDQDNQVIHRDIKPVNILFDQQGIAKISDLGIAQTFQDTTLRVILGSNAPPHPGDANYMSPEQGKSLDRLLPTSDIYSLGCVLYEALSGRLYKSTSGRRLSDIRPDTPEWLDHLLEKMLRQEAGRDYKDDGQPHKRYRLVSQVLADVEAGWKIEQEKLLRDEKIKLELLKVEKLINKNPDEALIGLHNIPEEHLSAENQKKLNELREVIRLFKKNQNEAIDLIHWAADNWEKQPQNALKSIDRANKLSRGNQVFDKECDKRDIRGLSQKIRGRLTQDKKDEKSRTLIKEIEETWQKNPDKAIHLLKTIQKDNPAFPGVADRIQQVETYKQDKENQAKLQQLFKQAESLVDEKPEVAEKLIREIIEQDKNFPGLHSLIDRVEKILKKRKSDALLETYTKAAHNSVASDPARALEYLAEIRIIDPGYPGLDELEELISNTLVEKKVQGEIERLFEQAIATQSSDPYSAIKITQLLEQHNHQIPGLPELRQRIEWNIQQDKKNRHLQNLLNKAVQVSRTDRQAAMQIVELIEKEAPSYPGLAALRKRIEKPDRLRLAFTTIINNLGNWYQKKSFVFWITSGSLFAILIVYWLIFPLPTPPPYETITPMIAEFSPTDRVEPIKTTLVAPINPATKPEATYPISGTPTPTFEIVSTIISPRDGMVMMYIPAGEFTMGASDEDQEAHDNEKPQHNVFLDAFWIDRTEVTNAMYALCITAGGCGIPRKSASTNDSQNFWDPEFEEYPIRNISWEEARTYCQWVGKRLPTEAEWEKAAQGLEKSIYPWGNTISCSETNYSRCVNSTTKVGSYPSGASRYGLMDMAGNVSEWVADWYSENYYNEKITDNPTGPASGIFRVMRGGSYMLNASLSRITSRRGFFPDESLDSFGFRCASTIMQATNIAEVTSIPSLDQNTLGLTSTPYLTNFPPANAQVGDSWLSPVDDMILVYVPAGEFIMGSSDDDSLAYDYEKPAKKISLEGFWVDRTEVTNAMYAMCMKSGVCIDVRQVSNTRSLTLFNPLYQDNPVIDVTWDEAKRYCTWAERRLPTNAEWEKAARGSDGRIFPWGNRIDCKNANYWEGDKGCVGDTSAVGSYPNFASPYGALDMAGNVWEWAADIKGSPIKIYKRGGAWNVSARMLRTAHYIADEFSGSDIYTGFRCVYSP